MLVMLELVGDAMRLEVLNMWSKGLERFEIKVAGRCH